MLCSATPSSVHPAYSRTLILQLSADTLFILRKIIDEDCVKIKQKINIVITKPTYLLAI